VKLLKCGEPDCRCAEWPDDADKALIVTQDHGCEMLAMVLMGIIGFVCGAGAVLAVWLIWG